MKEISVEELSDNPFKMIGKDWMLITAEKEGKVNTMTASWGGMGIIWNKPVATVYIRKSRYTKEFIDAEDGFSLCILPEEYRDKLGYCGKISGRNEDKVKNCGFSVNHIEEVPYFEESRLVLKCKKLYSQEMNAASFVKASENFPNQFYSDNDWHVMYIAEIEKVLVK
ncbi:MAG: flavin reductase [Treponema sp.]|nr:flavin reductase [Treponema sp.]